jgi:hypothetical protein
VETGVISIADHQPWQSPAIPLVVSDVFGDMEVKWPQNSCFTYVKYVKSSIKIPRFSPLRHRRVEFEVVLWEDDHLAVVVKEPGLRLFGALAKSGILRFAGGWMDLYGFIWIYMEHKHFYR